MFNEIERLKREYTDKYVVVDARLPELRRFDGHVGQVKTVNMSGRALVQFDAWSNIGWYDIDPGYLKVVPKPEAAEGAKQQGDKHAAPRPAAKPTPATAGGEKKLSALEMARMQGAAQGPAATAAVEKPSAPAAAGAKKSTADILAAARAGKASAAGAPASPAKQPAPAAPTPKMSTAEILAAARAKKAAEAPTPPAPAHEPVAEQGTVTVESTSAPESPPASPPVAGAAPEKAASAKPAFPPGQRPSVPEILAWCRQHDAK